MQWGNTQIQMARKFAVRTHSLNPLPLYPCVQTPLYKDNITFCSYGTRCSLYQKMNSCAHSLNASSLVKYSRLDLNSCMNNLLYVSSVADPGTGVCPPPFEENQCLALEIKLDYTLCPSLFRAPFVVSSSCLQSCYCSLKQACKFIAGILKCHVTNV